MGLFIETGWASLSKFEEELCGDNVEIIKTPKAIVAVLADGLGSGVKANILSKMTAKIIATMFENGASLEEVVDTISNTLPVCQRRSLAYSTFTIIQISKSGETYVVEFDNPPFFYLHQGRVIKADFIETEICGKKIKESRFKVNPGDILVAVSDGVIHAGIGGVLNLGWQWRDVADYLERLSIENSSPKTLSQWLLNACEQLYAGKPGDDTTVMTLKVRMPKSLTVAVGPPQNRQDDSTLVNILMNEYGQKVICGGTTSTIVANALGTKIEVDMNKLDPLIPPVGRLKGIDLVTEGIITLTKTRDLLKTVSSEENLPVENNGVTSLARLFLESDCIKFIVGRAVNPAHQNPELPMSLVLKMQVVTEISEILKGLGKEIEVQYF